jgi:hypothetical protein
VKLTSFFGKINSLFSQIRSCETTTFSNPLIYDKIFENFNTIPNTSNKIVNNIKIISSNNSSTNNNLLTNIINNSNSQNNIGALNSNQIKNNANTQNSDTSISSTNRKLCPITGEPAKYFDPLTKQPYANKEAFKVLREKYFQKEEDSLLFRIQTLSDLASQKKEKLKKLLLQEGGSGGSSTNNPNTSTNINLINMVNKYGILKSEGSELEKKVISRKKILFKNLNNKINFN